MQQNISKRIDNTPFVVLLVQRPTTEDQMPLVNVFQKTFLGEIKQLIQLLSLQSQSLEIYMQ